MKLINSKAEYEAIMSRIDELVELVDDHTPHTDKNYFELDFLTDLVVAYEKEHYPIGKPSLPDPLKTRMCERIRRIHRELNIDANVILGAI